MSFDSKKREEIKKYILRKIALDDKELIAKSMDSFGISITSVKRYIKELIDDEAIMSQSDCSCGYCLIEHVFEEEVPLSQQLEEDRLYASLIKGNLVNCNANALRIWQYACAEILNNAIEHSRGGNLRIIVNTNVLFSRIIIVDDGVGVFQTLLEYMAGHGWDHPCADDALLELYKGKFTSDADKHSGEGIFFSAKVMDEFAIWSDNRVYKCGYSIGIETIEHRLLAYVSRICKIIGTMVMMTLENETDRNLSEVFDMYTDIEEGFIRTSIPVKEACLTGEPVARSQARRICNRLDEFKEIILDFDRVEVMGQGFADELFRVYVLAHPQVTLCPINMIAEVERMIRHVTRGRMPENVRMPEN